MTYLSKAHVVDEHRIALSNQFMSKSAHNLAENPQASMLLTDAATAEQYRLHLRYERTERRGPLFDRLREEVDAVAAMSAMTDVFRLRSADIYRVESLQVVPCAERADGTAGVATLPTSADRDEPSLIDVAELCARIGRSADLDTLVRVTVTGLAALLGYEHTLLMLLDEEGRRLFTIASHGYDWEGVGSEVAVGEGAIGLAADQVTTVRLANAGQMSKYSRCIRQAFEESGHLGPGREVPLPGLEHVHSLVAAPAVALGQLVGVIAVEDRRVAIFGPADDAALGVVATALATAVESIRAEERLANATRAAERSRTSCEPVAAPPSPSTVPVRFFPVDGSTFLDGDYLIKGVAGRILWSLLRQHDEEGRTEFTNREVRLDPTLDLPDFRDNFESRLILLKRRLDEREAPIRIEKTGRGRFRLRRDARRSDSRSARDRLTPVAGRRLLTSASDGDVHDHVLQPAMGTRRGRPAVRRRRRGGVVRHRPRRPAGGLGSRRRDRRRPPDR